MAELRAVSITPGWLRTAAAIIPLLVALALSAGRPFLSPTTEVLVLVAVIVAASATGDRWAGITAALSSAVWFDFFLTQPYLRFTINGADDVEATVLLLLIGGLVTELALWGRRQQARASRRAGYLDGVLGTAELMMTPYGSVESLTGRVAEEITDVLGIDGCRLVLGRDYDARSPLLDHDGSVVRQGHSVNVERDGMPTDDETVLLVRRGGRVAAQFLLTSSTQIARPTLEERKVAVLLADQVAQLLNDQSA